MRAEDLLFQAPKQKQVLRPLRGHQDDKLLLLDSTRLRDEPNRRLAHEDLIMESASPRQRRDVVIVAASRLSVSRMELLPDGCAHVRICAALEQ